MVWRHNEIRQREGRKDGVVGRQGPHPAAPPEATRVEPTGLTPLREDQAGDEIAAQDEKQIDARRAELQERLKPRQRRAAQVCVSEMKGDDR